MSRGGRRHGGGYKHKADIAVTDIFIGRSVKLRLETIDARIRELNSRGTEDAKTEACRLSAQGIRDLIDHVLPKLQAVVANNTTTINYIARLPAPIESIDEWQKSTKLLLSPPVKKQERAQKASSLLFPDADPLSSFGNLNQDNKPL